MQVMRVLISLLLLSLVAFAAEPCSVKFTVVTKDDLGNVKQGVSADTLKWLSKKMSKKYPDVCYEAPDDNVTLAFWVSLTPATYNGYRTVTHQTPTTATVTDQDGNISRVNTTATSTSAVPESVDYQVVILSVLQRQPDESWKALHVFRGKTIHPTMYGLCTRNCHPLHSLIESGMKWVHAGGLSDPLQTVLVQEPK